MNFHSDNEIPSYASPELFQEQEILLRSGQWTLPGSLTIPKNQIPFAAVVLIHGSGAQDRDASIADNKPFRDIALGLASLGIAVLRYEKRTWRYGEELLRIEPEITANEDVLDDAISGVHLLRRLININSLRIFLLGHSLGGMLLPKLVNRIENVAGLILLAAPSRPFEDVLLSQAFYIYEASKNEDIVDFQQERLELIKEQVKNVKSLGLSNNSYSSIDLPLGYPASYWLYLRNYDPLKTAEGLSYPMLILQGEKDDQVIMEDFHAWQKALLNKQRVTFNSYKNLDHLFIKIANNKFMREINQVYRHVDGEVIHDIYRWIKNN